MWHCILFRHCRIKQIVMIWYLHYGWYTFPHWQDGTLLIPVRWITNPAWIFIDIIPHLLLVSQQNYFKITEIPIILRSCTIKWEGAPNPSRKTSTLYQPLLYSYHIAAVVISYVRVRLAGHGFCVVAELSALMLPKLSAICCCCCVQNWPLLWRLDQRLLRKLLIHMAEFCK